jgi:RNA polymerase sigma-70 factor (ECF subfamily)
VTERSANPSREAPARVEGAAATDAAAEPPKKQAGPTDAALVLEARSGARWAQEALFRRYQRMVSGLIFRVYPTHVDLDDLVQDTFIAAFQSLGSLKNPQAFASWLGSTAIRVTHKKLRRRKLAMRLGLAAQEEIAWEEVIAPTCPADIAAELKRTYAIIESMPTNERIALVLRRVEGMSLDEIVAATGASLATVKRRISAAEARLEEALKEKTQGT